MEELINNLFMYSIGSLWTALATGFVVFEDKRSIAVIGTGALSVGLSTLLVPMILGGN